MWGWTEAPLQFSPLQLIDRHESPHSSACPDADLRTRVVCVCVCVYAEQSCSRGLWRNPGNPRLWSHFLKNMFSLPVSCGPALVVFQAWAWRKDRVERRSYSQSFARPLVLINRLFLILTHIFKRITAASNKGACADWLGLWPRWLFAFTISLLPPLKNNIWRNGLVVRLVNQSHNTARVI